MNKYKKLVGNSFIFAIGNLGSKLMQFVMVPIYSYTLNSSEFGKADFLTNLISLIAPVVCLDLYDAVFRFALDKDEDKEKILNTGFIFTFFVSVTAIIVGIFLEQYVNKYPVNLTIWLLIFTMFFSLISNYARAVGFVKKFAAAGIINTFMMGAMNILLLIVFKKGIEGYLFSMIFALAVSCLYILCTTKIYKSLTIRLWSFSRFKEMCKYSIPLIPNSLAWWLNSTSDRFFIIMFLGSGWNGIYAMANKIPNMLSTLTSIFFQSWQMSAVEEYSSKDSKEFITNVSDFFISFLFLCSFVLITVIRPLFGIVLSSQYYIGWKLTPLVLLTVIYSSLSGFLGTMYTATKKTFPIFLTTVTGAIVNVILSILLIPHLSVYGAAIANVISFFIVTCIRYFDIVKQNKISLNYGKFAFFHVVFFLFSFLLFKIPNDFFIILIGLLIVILQCVIDKRIRKIILTIYKKYFSYFI